MTLADEVGPVRCQEMLTESITKQTIEIKRNQLSDEDDLETRLKKLAVLAKNWRQIKENAKEGLKSAGIGFEEVARIIEGQSHQKTLDMFGETEMSLVTPEGKRVTTKVSTFAEMAELIGTPEKTESRE